MPTSGIVQVVLSPYYKGWLCQYQRSNPRFDKAGTRPPNRPIGPTTGGATLSSQREPPAGHGTLVPRASIGETASTLPALRSPTRGTRIFRDVSSWDEPPHSNQIGYLYSESQDSDATRCRSGYLRHRHAKARRRLNQSPLSVFPPGHVPPPYTTSPSLLSSSLSASGNR